jgi:5-methylcytosine-specific restriction endonuclease McrBC regulatory subunit McrC
MMVVVMIRTKDNSEYNVKDNVDITNLSLYSEKKIEDKEIRNLLIFPHYLNKYHDDIHKESIFTLSGNQLITNNIMGFIGINDTQLCIASRFSNDESDNFFHYMLQKVFSINMFDFKFKTGKDTIWDFLKCLFPYFLNNALKQGLYKTYIRNNYNNEKLKGTIDTKRHIRLNIPYKGKNAYSIREHSFDNAVTQLIRHTIEYMKTSSLGKRILTANRETSENVKVILENTALYLKKDKNKIININNKIINHPYYTKYSILQRICLQILKNKKITFGKNKDKIYGILFDGAWLWEEYLNEIFIENNIKLEHPRNKEKKGGDHLFADGQPLYPDYIKRIKNSSIAYYVGDAKYKHLDRNGDKVNKEDYYQLITYMYRYECKKGFLFFPYSGDNKLFNRHRKINGVTENRVCIEVGLKIEQLENNYLLFKDLMKNNERKMCEYIRMCNDDKSNQLT